MYVRLKPTANVETALKQIETIVKKDNPSYPFTYQFADDQFNKMFLNEALISKLSRVFAALGYHYFLFRFIWISCLYSRTQDKRNRYTKSVRGKRFRYYNIIIKRFFAACCYIMHCCISCCMVDNA